MTERVVLGVSLRDIKQNEWISEITDTIIHLKWDCEMLPEYKILDGAVES